MTTMTHSCRESRQERIATVEQPFHFTDSGLSCVYLVGIKYYKCECGSTLADIPAVKQLMQLIARDLLEKPGSLTGEEIRFLRKRLGKKQADFANEIGLEPETLSRYENDKLAVSEPSDKLIRLYYVAFSKDPNLDAVRKSLLDLLAQWKVSAAPKKIVAKVSDGDEWEQVQQAA